MAQVPGLTDVTERALRDLIQSVRLFLRDFPELNRLVK